jgi:hypothetical protein
MHILLRLLRVASDETVEGCGIRLCVAPVPVLGLGAAGCWLASALTRHRRLGRAADGLQVRPAPVLGGGGLPGLDHRPRHPGRRLTQADIDAFYTSHKVHQRQAIRSFLTWAIEAGHIPSADVPVLRFARGPPA